MDDPVPLLRLVLDTSLFSNPDTARSFGDRPSAALAGFLEQLARAHGQVRAYMPPSVYQELEHFLDEPPPALFEALVALQPPRRAVQVPGALLYELIHDIRKRIDRGLRVAERAVREAHPEGVERSISLLRERYRDALRAGLLDSKEDVDLILLALELDAAIVSADQGVVAWAERIGVRIVHAERLKDVLEELIRVA